MRRLTPIDRSAVIELVRTVDPEDWVLQELDLLLTGPGPDGVRGYGGYGIEVPGGRLAGVGLVDFTRPGEAYLGALRVAANLQNRGYGTHFLRELLAVAAGCGGRRAWLVSALDNTSMHRIAEKVGFVRVGEWQVWINPDTVAPSPDSPPALKATPDDQVAVAEWFGRHPLSGEEVVAAPDYGVWDVSPIASDDISKWLASGELVMAESGGMIGVMACHWGSEGPPELRIRYLKGAAPAVGRLLAWAREEGRTRPRAVLSIGLPGPQAEGARVWVNAAQDGFRGYVFMRPLGDCSPVPSQARRVARITTCRSVTRTSVAHRRGSLSQNSRVPSG